RMRANDAANLLRRLTVDSTKSFLKRLPETRSEKLVDLLRYPEATVGGIMTNDMVTLTLDQTVREALLRLRDHLKQTDFTHFLYVVENETNRLLRGTTTLQELIVADEEITSNESINN